MLLSLLFKNRRHAIAASLLCLATTACELFFPTYESDPNANPEAGANDGRSNASDVSSTTSDGDALSGLVPPSCQGAPSAIDCTSTAVPAAMYLRSTDNVNASGGPSATVSEFRLDVYEVTVARFRAFVAAYATAGKPAVTAGRNPHDPTDPGWQTSYNTSLAPDAATMIQDIKNCSGTMNSTWTDAPSTEDDKKPINCLRWAEAFAFCIYDGGRLPTEAEWNLAAAGGQDQRVYPWSGPPNSTVIDADHAVFQTTAIAHVGTKPAGIGKFGQLDLAGNVGEWILDYDGNYPSPCIDCSDQTASGERVVRGGGFDESATVLEVVSRGKRDPLNHFADVGVRCAR